MQDKFLVAYCTGWVEGGGVDNLGTGDDVWAKIVTPAGEVGERIDVSVQDGMRDWWPLVAGSDRNWLVVWQRYEGDDRDPACTVHAAIVGPSGRVQARTEIMAHAKPYYYNVSYVPALGAYAVWGSQKTGGFLVLVDRQGQIVNAKRQLPPTVRESKLVSSPASKPGKAVVAYPVFGGGAAVLEMTRDSIAVVKQVRGEYRWDYIGTDGYFVNPDKAVFASLSRNGVQFVTVDGLAK
jgi:hypothetical protein